MVLHNAFAPIKKFSPGFVWRPLRKVLTAILTPLLFSYRTGHFRSSIRGAAVDRKGEPVPWYAYPCIDFLTQKNYRGKTVLEFGCGQSTLWWANRAARVVALEGDKRWYEKLKQQVPQNVDLFLVSMESPDACVKDVWNILQSAGNVFELVIIDGLYRYEMIDIACAVVAGDGAIICDNASGYGFHEGFRDRSMNRVDFFGNAPGVILPQCTSIFFKQSFLFSPENPTPSISP